MLDTLRKNVRRLSWTLWLVIAAFIILYFPDLVNGGGTGEVVASVDGEEIHAIDFQRALNEQLSYYRNLNQGELPEDFIRQMQLHSVVLEQLVRRRLLVAAARDQGFGVAPQEIKDRLMEFPAFRNSEGRWVGDAEYRNIVRQNGMDLAAFEQGVVDDLLVDRMTNLITEGVAVSDQDVQDAYQRQNEKVAFEFVQIRPSAFEFEVESEIGDAEVRARYADDPEVYRMAEQRKLSYSIVDTETLRDSLVVDEADLRTAYQDSIDEFTIDEQVKARQIMLRVLPAATDEEKAEVQTRAQDILAQLQDGADFAALAEELSDDPSAAAGGDLGWVTRGRQVEGFDEVVFDLEAGQTTDVFESAFGFNIVRVEEKRASEVQAFDEVRGQLEQRVAWERAENDADALSDELRREVLRGSSLEDVAARYSLEVSESDLAKRSHGESSSFTTNRFSISLPNVLRSHNSNHILRWTGTHMSPGPHMKTYLLS